MGRASKRSGSRSAEPPAQAPIGRSSVELVRAVGGGLIIGLPLLFTMEMWFHSFLLPTWKILVLLAVAFVIVIGYNAVSGFRRDRSWGELILDSVETMGIAAVVATLALLVLGRIGPDTDLRDGTGKVALEMIAVAFGVSLAGTQLARPESAEDEQDRGSEAADGRGIGPFGRLFVAAGAALLFALNVAPTEEPMLLGIEAGGWLPLVAMLFSLVVTFAIVFYAEFRGGSSTQGRDQGPLGHPIGETLAAYGVSLFVSVLLLWSFGRTEGTAPHVIASQTVMLAVVASFGAALGRLLVGGDQPRRTSRAGS